MLLIRICEKIDHCEYCLTVVVGVTVPFNTQIETVTVYQVVEGKSV